MALLLPPVIVTSSFHSQRIRSFHRSEHAPMKMVNLENHTLIDSMDQRSFPVWSLRLLDLGLGIAIVPRQDMCAVIRLRSSLLRTYSEM